MNDDAPRPFPSPGPDVRCPCQSGDAYGTCCGPLHAGAAVAPTAERLMRSRYSAYVVGDRDYLLATWHPSTRPAHLDLDAHIRWFGLEILSRTRGGMLDTAGTVGFRASYRAGAETGDQSELSRFVRQGRQWFYVDGS
jgi:SEC-C motif-containing protein